MGLGRGWGWGFWSLWILDLDIMGPQSVSLRTVSLWIPYYQFTRDRAIFSLLHFPTFLQHLSFFLFFSLLVFLIQQSIHIISQMINGQCNFVTAVSHGRISIWCGCEMKYDPYLCLLLHCKIIFPPLFFFSLCVVSKNSAYKNEQKFSKVI